MDEPSFRLFIEGGAPRVLVRMMPPASSIARGRPFCARKAVEGGALLACSAAVFLMLVACEAPEVVPRDSREPRAKSEGSPLERLDQQVERGSSGADEGDVASLIERADSLSESLFENEVGVDVAVELGRIYDIAGRLPEAIDWYRQAIEAAEETLKELESLVEEGVDEAGEVPAGCRADGAAASVEAAAARAGAIIDAGDEELALSCYRAALEPVAGALRGRGEAWWALDSHVRAFVDLERALLISPGDPRLSFLLGAVAFEMEPVDLGPSRAARAREAWTRFIEMEPEDPLAERVREALPHVDSLIEGGGFEP